MSEVPLRRRIPPKLASELYEELLNNPDLSQHDAMLMAKQMHDQAMEEIYRLARIGEAFERLKYCPGGATDFWRGYAEGWNGAQKWVREAPSRTKDDMEQARRDYILRWLERNHRQPFDGS